MNNEVEIIKIGEILRNDILKNESRFVVMTVEDDDPTVNYYLSIFKDYVQSYLPNYSLLKTQGIIRGSGEDRYFSGNFNGLKSHKHIRGRSDGDPIIGQSFTINNSSWHTSKVDNIIGDNIIMTKNSVYAIHNTSSMREQKLKNLGID